MRTISTGLLTAILSHDRPGGRLAAVPRARPLRRLEGDRPAAGVERHEEHRLEDASCPGRAVPARSSVGDHVYVTCYSGYGLERFRQGKTSAEAAGRPRRPERHLVCVDAATGKVLWTKDRGRPGRYRRPVQGRQHRAARLRQPHARRGRVGRVRLLRRGRGGRLQPRRRAEVGAGAARAKAKNHTYGSAASPLLYEDLLHRQRLRRDGRAVRAGRDGGAGHEDREGGLAGEGGRAVEQPAAGGRRREGRAGGRHAPPGAVGGPRPADRQAAVGVQGEGRVRHAGGARRGGLHVPRRGPGGHPGRRPRRRDRDPQGVGDDGRHAHLVAGVPRRPPVLVERRPHGPLRRRPDRQERLPRAAGQGRRLLRLAGPGRRPHLLRQPRPWHLRRRRRAEVRAAGPQQDRGRQERVQRLARRSAAADCSCAATSTSTASARSECGINKRPCLSDRHKPLLCKSNRVLCLVDPRTRGRFSGILSFKERTHDRVTLQANPCGARHRETTRLREQLSSCS